MFGKFDVFGFGRLQFWPGFVGLTTYKPEMNIKTGMKTFTDKLCASSAQKT